MQVVYLHLKKGTHDKEATKPLDKEVERRKYRKKKYKISNVFRVTFKLRIIFANERHLSDQLCQFAAGGILISCRYIPPLLASS